MPPGLARGHALVHRAEDSGITGDFLTALEDDTFELVDFELAKIGMPLLSKAQAEEDVP